MTMLKQLALLSAITLAIDGIYLYLSSGPFVKMVERVQGSQMKTRWSGAIASYIIIVALIYKFVIIPRASMTDAFILGALAYGLYDAVNYALLKNWDLMLAMQDTIWGGILFVLVSKLYLFMY
jgi:uncharacterized membrane protein